MSAKIKLNIQKRGDRIASLESIQSSDNYIANKRTFANYRSILNKVNLHFGWEPDKVYYDRLNDKKEEIADFCQQQWKISNIAHLTSIMRIISSLMTRTGFGDKHAMRSYSRSLNRILTVPALPVKSNAPIWTEIQPKLAAAADRYTVVGKIAAIFSYGYVLRVGEIFNTRIDKRDGYYNYLDLDECVWHVINQKNGKPKTFDVEGRLCKFLKGGNLGVWLLGKANGEQYAPASHILKSHKWKFPSNNDLRKSYETWNINDSGRAPQEIEYWNMVLGHSSNVAHDYYDQGLGAGLDSDSGSE